MMMYRTQVPGITNQWKHYLLLVIVALVAFWPLSTSFFSLKNDALVYFLPWRYHISEAIQNGYFPYWSPYLYTGLPLHSDMQAGVWNPLVLFISLFTRYNMTILQWEVIIYLIIAGVGMYKLLKTFSISEATSLVVASAYMCCGFITDSISFIPWMTSAAYLPFLFMYFYRLLYNASTDSAIKFAITLVLLLTAGYPSFFIYALYILLTAAVLWVAVKIKNKKTRDAREFFKYGILAIVVFVFVSSPAVISYWEFLHYYQRGQGATLPAALTNSFNLFSTISFLIPSAVARPHEYINSDVSARNIYTGLILLFFFVLSLTKKLNSIQKFILGVTIFSFVFSLGSATPLREWCYRLLPFMDSFRHPATIRIFSCIGILILAASAIDNFILNRQVVKNRLLLISCGFTVILLVIILNNFSGAGGFKKFQDASYSVSGIKALLDGLSFAEIGFAEGCIQLIFILLFIIVILKRKINTGLFSILLILNSIVFAWLALPFTAISQVRTSEVNNYINSFPDGFPAPGFYEPIRSGIYSDSIIPSSLGYENFYNKKIRIQDHIISPTINSNYENFLAQKKLRVLFNDYPYCYFADKSFQLPLILIESLPNKKIIVFDSIQRPDLINNFASGRIVLQSFNPNKFVFETDSPGFGLLNLFQQYNQNWTAMVNDVPFYVYRTNIAFIGIVVPPGRNTIIFEYKPRFVHSALQITIVTLLLIAIYFIFKWRKNSNPAHD